MSGGHESHGGHDDHHAAPSGGGGGGNSMVSWTGLALKGVASSVWVMAIGPVVSKAVNGILGFIWGLFGVKK